MSFNAYFFKLNNLKLYGVSLVFQGYELWTYGSDPDPDHMFESQTSQVIFFNKTVMTSPYFDSYIPLTNL